MLPGKKITPEFMLDVLRRRYWLIAVPFVVCTFAALVVSAKLPNMYQAQMLIQTVPQRVPDAYVRSTVTMRIDNRLAGVSHQVLSLKQLEELIKEFNLYESELATMPLENVVDFMRSQIQVEIAPPPRGQLPDAFFVRFTYPDAPLSAQVTERLGSLFVDENARDRGALADATNSFLEQQLADARAQLEAQEQKLEAFRQRHAGSLPSQLDTNAESARNAQMQVQAIVEGIARDRDRRMMLERLYRDAEADPIPVPAPPPQASADPTASVAALGATTQQQLESARANLARLEMRLKPEHPDVIRAKRQIGDLEARLASEKTSKGPSAPPTPTVTTPEVAARAERLRQMRAEIESLDRQIAFKEQDERRVRELIADYQRRIEAVPGLESEWAVLNRDINTLQLAYNDLRQKSEQSKMAAELEKKQISEQFRVVDAPRVPTSPISPVRFQINGIGAAVGLLLGLVLVALFELTDTSFRTRGDIMDVLELPVLANVPLVESDADVRARKWRSLLTSAAAVVALSAGGYVFWVMRLWKYVV